MLLFEVMMLVWTLLPMAAGFLDQRAYSDPVRTYLSRMCYPTYYDATPRQLTLIDRVRVLANSTFPCEQATYIRIACVANGTDVIDFLAEQQCLCGSSYWELGVACDNCFLVHGAQNRSYEGISSSRSSLSAAECTPSPPYQPFLNLLTTVNPSIVYTVSYATLDVDQFPSNTEVSNYYTGTRKISLGEITGSATARHTTWYTGNWATFTPTTPPAQSHTGTTTREAATSNGTATNEAVSSTPAASSITSTASGNAAEATGGVHAYGSVLVVGLGIVAML